MATKDLLTRNPEEEWRPVVGYEGLYEVSSLGRVRSLDRTSFVPRGTGGYARRVKGRVLSPDIIESGHSRVLLSADGVVTRQQVHRLVAQAFIPNPSGLPLVLHGPNGVSDNSSSNLRWGTNADNMRDRVRDGTCANSRKTHCPQGHEYSEDNTRVRANGGGRQCLTCIRERSERWRNSVKTRLGTALCSEILQLNSDNRPSFWIARELGIREQDVSRLLHLEGRKSLRVSDRGKYDVIDRMVKEGCSHQEIARTVRCDHRTIRRWFPGTAWPVGGGGMAAVLRKANRIIEDAKIR